ncbi:MAG: DNA primase [Lachnospira sp.]|uniref:DNA primase n=1 Tax=Lachnospira pectinoschiza TaxID=28052 RepID=A0A1G9YFR9_9FIRM|nr:DNA primase [Lachnospira pectinoschiza]MCR5516786.1 DNA primase [Lachnospira sp.]SDN07877.1 DNA primase [Lachnospira pectinoschiza]
MYSREVIEEVLSKTDIVDLVSNYVKLKRSGSSYMGLCPFHNEKSPSFSVSGPKQLFHCFGCGKGGNAITFVMEYENYTFIEALEMLAQRAGVALPEQKFSREDQMDKDIKTKLLEINKFAATYYYHCLKSEKGTTGMDYLANKRQLSDKTITSYGLGFAPISSGGLYKELKAKGYTDDILKESGLFTYDSKVHEKFWNRVIFPIMDVNNKVIGFGGRVMGDAKPKYLNSPETKLFDKSRNLYGLNVARSARKGNMIICEGYMDVISLHQAGFNQAVASLGTALTPGHARLLKRYTDTVLITYDSDEAGTKAALRAIPLLTEVGLNTKVINMKPYKDPDEFIKALGAEAFQERIDKAINSFIFEVGVVEKRHNRSDPADETAFEKELAEMFLRFGEKLERDNYIKAVCNTFVIPLDGMMQMVANLGNKKGLVNGQAIRTDYESPKPKKKKQESGIRQAEKLLLTWLINDVNIINKISDVIKPSDFIDPLLNSVASKLYAQIENGNPNPALIVGDYTDETEAADVASLFSSDLDENLSKQERERAINDIVKKVKKNSLDNEFNTTTDAKRMQEIMQEQMNLNKINIKL